MSTIFNYHTKGFNNYESLQQARCLKKIRFSFSNMNNGRGKKAVITKEYVYNTEEDEEVRTKIINTIKHYESKLETIPKENNK